MTKTNPTADDEVKAENAAHAVEILNKLNLSNVEFVYHGDTNEHGLPVVYRHFDGIKDGHNTCFGLIEIVIDGKLDAVRFINNYREQFTDIKIGNAKYTLGDKGEINLIDEPETKADTPEENVEKLFDAYEAQNSVAHISENGYIAAVNFQPQNTVRWHCKIRRYENLDEAIDAVRYVNEHDTFTVTRGGRVETEYGKRNERTREYFARNLYGVEYFKEAYFDELVDQYAVTVDAFNFAVEYEIEEAEYAAAESRAIARILANDNLAARYYKAKAQVKCERYENGYCGWYFKGKHSDDWEHDETKAAACLTKRGLLARTFVFFHEDETAVINSNGYDESAFDLLPTVDELNDVEIDDEAKTDEPATETVNSETETVKLDGITEINNETVKFFDGKFLSVFSHTYHGAIVDAGGLHYCVFNGGDTEVYDVRGHEVSYDEFMQIMAQRAEQLPDEPQPPTNDKPKAAEAADTVKAEFDKAVAESVNEYSATVEINGETLTFEDGQLTEVGSTRYEAYFTIRNGRRNFYYRGNRFEFPHVEDVGKSTVELAEELTALLLKVTPLTAGFMDLTLQDGKTTAASPRTAIIEPDWHGNGRFAFVTPWNEVFARYDTASQVRTVIYRIKHAIEDKRDKFKYPTLEEMSAPDYREKHWAVDFDIYHADSELTNAELEAYTDKLREAMTVNGNIACVELEDSVITIYGDLGGDNDTVDKIVTETCKRGCWVEYPEDEGDANEKARLG